ncbi:brevican core protein-like [Mercenaria mercenaria]|uniref:brevican core protein-like n=1 Tax=Mercenaria mercenaria TaxID=6596 RepID=UPI001E1D4989|nr:brevican core protein-like [Mercenaria mercenaria]
MKLILHFAVICLAFATTCFTGPETAADAKPIPGCASNTECPQGRRISRHVQGQPEPRSESSDSDVDDDSLDSNSGKGSSDSDSGKDSSDLDSGKDSSDSDSCKDSSDLNPDRCSTDPCRNNGTCVEGADNYTCSCTDGFRGRNCEEAACQEGWFFFNGSCYYLGDMNLDWLSAVAACNESGAYLAEIQSQQELDFLVTITDLYDLFWIGLNDRKIEGEFVWHKSGDPLSFVNPAYSFSGSFPNLDCVTTVELYTGVNYHFWFTDKCSLLNLYICEKEPMH